MRVLGRLSNGMEKSRPLRGAKAGGEVTRNVAADTRGSLGISRRDDDVITELAG